MKDEQTRVFFVVFGNDTARELFETLDEAESFIRERELDPRHSYIAVSIVKHAYKEDETWNYEDLSDTFEDIYYVR